MQIPRADVASDRGRIMASIRLCGMLSQGGRRCDDNPAELLWRGMRLACTHVWQSEEFEGQRGGQVFGALSLTIPF
jgi:hypothetical protein